MLLDAVKERLGADRVHLNHSLHSFEHQDDEQVKLRFVQKRSGEQAVIPAVTADLCVAADGINSTVRRILYPDEGPPNFSGRMLWRGFVERKPFLTSGSMIWSGHANQKFIAYPIRNYGAEAGSKSLVNWIAELRVRDESDPDTTPPEQTSWLHDVPKERFAGQFEKWTFGFLDVPELIAQTDKVFEYPMCDRNPADRWSFGSLTLLGDSAHPMYPIGSNGASQAILDAECLTRCLLKWRSGDMATIAAALRAYQDERLPITAKIVMANRGNGPDHVLQVAYERAPDGFKHINDIIPQKELEDIGLAYKAIAGFEVERVNDLATQSEGTAERLGLTPPEATVNEAQ